MSDRFIPFAARLQVPDREVTLAGLEGGAWLLYPSRAYLPRRVRVVAEFLKANITGL